MGSLFDDTLIGNGAANDLNGRNGDDIDLIKRRWAQIGWDPPALRPMLSRASSSTSRHESWSPRRR